MADNYKHYIAALNQKIESVCQKEEYSNYLKEQKLKSVKKKTIIERKSTAESVEG